MTEHQYALTDPVAVTLDAWKGDAKSGEAVELGADVIDNVIHHIELLAGVIRCMEVADAQKDATIERLKRQLENQQYRRAS